MKRSALALVALILSAAPSAAQDATPPPTPVLLCDSNQIIGSRTAPVPVIETRSAALTSTVQRQTLVSISTTNGATRYFVDGAEVPIAQLGQAAAQAWLANTPGASIDQCWRDDVAPGTYTIAGRVTSLCRIAVLADDNTSYGRFSSARDALRSAGLTALLLVTPDQTRAMPDDHMPLNPVPVRLEGIRQTTVRVALPPDSTEPVITISNGEEWSATTAAQLQENLTLAAASNNPALTAEEISTHARFCVRPYSNVSYADVLRLILTIRDFGFVRVGLYSEAVIPIDDQGRRRF